MIIKFNNFLKTSPFINGEVCITLSSRIYTLQLEQPTESSMTAGVQYLRLGGVFSTNSGNTSVSNSGCGLGAG
jgi:hypothetical protein